MDERADPRKVPIERKATYIKGKHNQGNNVW